MARRDAPLGRLALRGEGEFPRRTLLVAGILPRRLPRRKRWSHPLGWPSAVRARVKRARRDAPLGRLALRGEGEFPRRTLLVAGILPRRLPRRKRFSHQLSWPASPAARGRVKTQ